jgi:hypothetical protein
VHISVWLYLGGGKTIQRVSAPIALDPSNYGEGATWRWLGEIMAIRAGDQLEEIITNLRARNQLEPCKPKIKLKGRIQLDTHIQGIRTGNNITVDGEGQLSIRDDGSFDASIPLAWRYVHSLTGQSIRCNGEASGHEVLRVVGAYREQREALLFEQMEWRDPDAIASVTCVVETPFGTQTRTDTQVLAVHGWGGLFTNLREAPMALADGTQVSRPCPPNAGAVICEATLELSYGGDGAVERPLTAEANTSSIRGPRSAARAT